MNDETKIENELQAKGLNAPRLKPADIDAAIRSETFTILPSGKCMVCELTLKNGFTVRGEAKPIYFSNNTPANGREVWLLTHATNVATKILCKQRIS